MGAFKRFEDIVAWLKARLANQLVYRLTREHGFVSDFALRDQIRRSSLSVMANIAEGHGRRSNREFATFLNFAHGSIAETQSHLYAALDLGYINREDFSAVYAQLDEISRMVMKLSQHLRANE